MIELKSALRLPPAPRLAMVGAGGKTTALFAIASQLHGPVLVTTTTHLAASQLGMADRHVEVNGPEQLERLEDTPLDGITLLTGLETDQGRVSGLEPDSLDRLKTLADIWQVPLLIEADGARLRALKAPGDHEPAIPPFVDQVVVTAGLSGLGQPLNDAWVHRPERFAALAGIPLQAPITIDALARMLTHPAGGLKNIPSGARRSVLMTRADRPDLQSQAYALAQRLLPEFASAVITASTASSPAQDAVARTGDDLPRGGIEVVRVVEQAAGIVLAAGASQRMGRLKQLLDWRGQPFVRAVAGAALTAGLSPVVVVTGSLAVAVASAVEDLAVETVYNPEWEAGQATSLRSGLGRIQPETGAAVFLLADQPQISPHLIRALVERHSASLAPIVAPQAGGRRANPVLFDRVTFTALEQLEGDVGGRAVFNQYPIEWIEWLDESILLDVDSPEDYRRLLDLH